MHAVHHYLLRYCLARISSTRLILPSLPPDEMDLSVRVPIRMSVCPSQQAHGMLVDDKCLAHCYSGCAHLVHCRMAITDGLHSQPAVLSRQRQVQLTFMTLSHGPSRFVPYPLSGCQGSISCIP